MDPGDKLLAQRIILLHGTIDDAVANEVIAKLLYLRSENAAAPIRLYLDSRGGQVAAALAIRDTMDEVPVSTHCVASAEGVAAMLLAHGLRGQRTAASHARLAFTRSTSADGHATEREIARVDALVAGMLAEDTGQTVETVTADCHTLRHFTATEARAYGLVDRVLT